MGTGLAILSVSAVRRDAPREVLAVMAAAGAFAAVSSIFGSPVIGAVLIIEASGLGGPTLPVVLLPGLIAAGVGSLVFVGLGSCWVLALRPGHWPRFPYRPMVGQVGAISVGRLCSQSAPRCHLRGDAMARLVLDLVRTRTSSSQSGGAGLAVGAV